MSSLLPRLFIILLLASSFAHATPPSQKQIDTLLEITHTREATATILVPQIKASIAKFLEKWYWYEAKIGNMEMKDEDHEKIEHMLDTFIYSLDEHMLWSEWHPLYSNVFTQHFDAEEVQHLIDFYSSSLGQNIISQVIDVSTQEIRKSNKDPYEIIEFFPSLLSPGLWQQAGIIQKLEFEDANAVYDFVNSPNFRRMEWRIEKFGEIIEGINDKLRPRIPELQHNINEFVNSSVATQSAGTH